MQVLVRDNDVDQALRALKKKMQREGREAHVRFCERAVVKFRRATRLVILGEAHLRRILSAYAGYYNHTRTHLALNKDCPLERPIQRFGSVTAIHVLAGLHHQYARI
jgi:hypothetical protein